MGFEYVIFDLDETLYPRKAGLMREIGRRIERWVQESLRLPPEEAAALRRAYLRRYGTTLAGLLAEGKVDADAYLAYVHDVPVERWLRPNPALARMLDGIPLRKVVFTNATAEHAWRVLQALGVADRFEDVIGIREVGLRSKPDLESYRWVLRRLGVPGTACILVDDRPMNLRPAKQLGMTTVLVDGKPEEGVDFVVKDVLEVGPLVARLLEEQEGR
ncbi:MAG TPA: pyrimidine 5'-nucleotidase [Thermoflexia bacterium]|nr:pyrimidine 5'-nucleotidase [Thermoflexia bacterium]